MGRKKKTKEEFIKEATEKHGDKYDYSKVHYVNSKTKVCIICPEHGEFWQEASGHLRGQSCPKCSGNYIPTTEEWVASARKVHGDKYDYSKVEYVNNHTKVCIICSEHGEFWQTPSAHLQGQGCPKCANETNGGRKRLSISSFIKKAREVHGDKYDYSKVEYDGAHTKVCIICPEHGEFWQTPNERKNGCGCPICGNEAKGERCRSSKEEFIKKANEVHGGKYEYSKVEYVNNATKVCIICPKHGNFEQTPNSHLRGCGCPNCSFENTGDRCRSSLVEFIKKARKLHGDKYNYSNVEYVNSRIKVCIICSEHGEFWQSPNKHLIGSGCPKCNLSHLERSVMNYLDNVGITYDYQKRFKWLGKQSLDFYLPEYKVGIECQGEQHFFPVDFAGKGVEWACKEFDKLIERDKCKKALCEKHGIKLLYFGDTPNYNTFLGEAVNDDVQYLIDYLNEDKKS